MCGIAGIVHRDPDARVDERALLAMQDSLAHRGPDDSGVLLEPGVGLASTRLAILDLSSRGRMPMGTPDGRCWIAYNGEVYNYRELRRDLGGTALRSNTDTEVLLHLYARDGAGMLERLNGMFAFAIWDARDRTLLLARDRLGVKPLYYALHRNALLFASEQKALFAAGLDPVMDLDAWGELLCHRFVAGERTPFHGIARLLPGHFLAWRGGELTITRWWHLAERARARRSAQPGTRGSRRGASSAAEWFRATFDEAVEMRRISDVPIGVLLSGGLDSSSVAAALAQREAGPLASFTVRFGQDGYDEGPAASAVARSCRLLPYELTLDAASAAGRLADATALNDEPLAHSSDIHLWAVAAHARPHVTVLLSGEGSDETLGGYVRYRPLRHRAWLWAARHVLPRRADSPRLPARVAKLARLLALGSARDLVLFNACDVLPTDLAALGFSGSLDLSYREATLAEAEALYPGDLARQAMYVDQHTFLASLLHRNDRMTMGASIECRVPFLDYRLVEGLAALPSSVLFAGRGSKPLLRRAIGARLPQEVLRAPKWGFGVPWPLYLRAVPSLRDEVQKLPTVDPVRDGPFRPLALRRAIRAFLQGDRRHDALIVQLLMIAVWYRTCVAGQRPFTTVMMPSGRPGGISRAARHIPS